MCHKCAIEKYHANTMVTGSFSNTNLTILQAAFPENLCLHRQFPQLLVNSLNFSCNSCKLPNISDFLHNWN